MKQLPQAPRYLTRAEVNANRIQAAVRRRFTRVQNRAKLQTEVSQQFPFVVYLAPERHLHIDRFAIRQWFVSQLITVYEPSIDNRDKARVMFDDTWRVFRFARETDSVLFEMFWC
jgi:hypothetical protein